MHSIHKENIILMNIGQFLLEFSYNIWVNIHGKKPFCQLVLKYSSITRVSIYKFGLSVCIQ